VPTSRSLPSRRLLLRLLIALAALAFLTSACGGDDDSGDAASSTDGSSDSDNDGGDGNVDGGTDEEEEDDGDRGDLGDACDRISLAELETAFGFAWSEGESTPLRAGTVQCVWSDADPGPPAKVVSLAFGNDDSFEEAFQQSAEELYEGTKEFVEEADILEADLGLGDASYRTEGGIYVLDGDTYYSFTTIGGVSDDAVAGLKAMAATVVGD
jgi:hypothetical protein